MSAIWAVGEVVGGQPTRLTLELATLAGELAGAGGRTTVVLVGADPSAAAEVARHGPDVIVDRAGPPEEADATSVALAVAELIDQHEPDVLLIGGSPEGKDVAGTLLGLTDLPMLVAANGVTATDGRISVEMGTFGGRVITASSFASGGGIVLVRPGSVTARTSDVPGAVTEMTVTPRRTLPAVSVVERVAAPAGGPSIDGASIIVGVGRGVGGREGIELLEDLATSLGAAVGATRAVVDAGWMDFAQQIGQTGKTVKPDLYIAAGVSGAIQHKVGVQSVGTIVAIDTDRDAPISEYADVFVVGDLFEVVPRLTAAIHEAREGT